MEKHDHAGTGVSIFALLLLAIGVLLVTQHQFSVIYDRVGEMQRQLDCSPTETFVIDQDGNEYCLSVPTPDRG